jgi:hypothetical protein
VVNYNILGFVFAFLNFSFQRSVHNKIKKDFLLLPVTTCMFINCILLPKELVFFIFQKMKAQGHHPLLVPPHDFISALGCK